MEALLDLLIDFIFEFLLTGAVEAAGAKKIPLAIRLVVLSVVLLVYGILLYVAIKLLLEEQNIFALVVALAILVLFIMAVIRRYRQLAAEKRQ
jgi:Na+-driven multidrug efflux pump